MKVKAETGEPQSAEPFLPQLELEPEPSPAKAKHHACPYMDDWMMDDIMIIGETKTGMVNVAKIEVYRYIEAVLSCNERV